MPAKVIKLLLASLAIAPLASVPMTPATAQSVTSPADDIVISIGRGELVTIPGAMSDVFIANGCNNCSNVRNPLHWPKTGPSSEA